jgi:auxin efflux carrier family protein
METRLLEFCIWIASDYSSARLSFRRWFMPVNIAITFMVGSILGWIACNILKPPQHFRGLIISFCSAGWVSSPGLHVSFLFTFLKQFIPLHVCHLMLMSIMALLANAGNLGNLLLIIVPAVCDEDGNPFGRDRDICRSCGLSYSSLSMAVRIGNLSVPSF